MNVTTLVKLSFIDSPERLLGKACSNFVFHADRLLLNKM